VHGTSSVHWGSILSTLSLVNMLSEGVYYCLALSYLQSPREPSLSLAVSVLMITSLDSPFYDKVTIDLPSAPQPLIISAPGASSGKPYVAGLKVNGVSVEQPIIEHEAISHGGTIEFEMSSSPSGWASETVVDT
jgi:hypothetical protein